MKSVVTAGSGHQRLRELSRGVLGEAEAEARQTVEDARARAASIRQAAQAQAETRREEILQRARRAAEPLHRQAVASAEMQAQRLRLESRETLLSQVFLAARERLPSVTQWPDYPDILRFLIREAATNLAVEELVLHADAEAHRHLSDAFLAELGGQLGVRLQRGQLLNDEVGIVAETPDGHRRYHNTLGARLQRLRETLRAPVYRMLRGEVM